MSAVASVSTAMIFFATWWTAVRWKTSRICATSSSRQSKGVPIMQQWEYTVVEITEKQFPPYNQDREMNKMAADGWRLVSVVQGSNRSIYLYFERPKQ